MRWVNDTFPPRPRPRWLLITMRLSTRSLAGTARTLVAVGTVRLAAMFTAVRAAAPRSRTSVTPAADGAGPVGEGGGEEGPGEAGPGEAGPGGGDAGRADMTRTDPNTDPTPAKPMTAGAPAGGSGVAKAGPAGAAGAAAAET